MKTSELFLLLGLSLVSVVYGQETRVLSLQRRLIHDRIDSIEVRKYFSNPKFGINDTIRKTKKAYSKVNYFDKKRDFWQEKTFQRDLDTLVSKKELFDKFESIYGQCGMNRFAVVSLFEMESNLGNLKGNHSVFNAYVSEYLDDKAKETRREWFYDLLKILIRKWPEIQQNTGLENIFDLKGSWAGAFGPMQIMTDEYEEDFIDFNGDGKKNPLDLEDCIGSIVKVLVRKGLKKNGIRSALHRYNPAGGYAESIIEHARQLEEKYTLLAYR